MHPVTRAAVGTALTGAAALAYAAGYEVRSFRLRRQSVPVLAAGQPPLRILQLTDLHMTPGQRRKQDWVRRLAGLKPDLVIDTGDNLAHLDAVPSVLRALEPLLELPGAFVFGSNDIYAPVPKNPARYLMADTGDRAQTVELPWRDLRDQMAAAGWADLTNARSRVLAGSREVELVGVDDPHIWRDRYAAVQGPFTAALNDYIRRELKYESDLPYEVLTGNVRPWNYGEYQNRYLNVAETLRRSITQNPHLKVMVANGYYDLATPYLATDYTFNHLILDPSLRGNITMTYYEAGHMMYSHKPSLVKLKKDLAAFIESALPK